MLSRVEFVLEEKWIEESGCRTQDAAETYRRIGLGTGARFVSDRGELPDGFAPEPSVLYLADSDRLIELLRGKGAPAAGFRHDDNGGEKLSGVPYIIEEPSAVDRDSLVKIWQRLHGIPWRILITERCIVREFKESDLDGIAALYDEEAVRWLEPPIEDRERERQILKAYIERIYGFYGYGQWAVLERSSGRLIGRMGFSFPSKEMQPCTAPQPDAGSQPCTGSQPETEAQQRTVPQPDAALGYLLAADRRGRGLAKEVCSGIVKYGFEELGFECISAEIDPENEASAAVARALGFWKAAKAGEKEIYFLTKESFT